jgi:hypothetical protein
MAAQLTITVLLLAGLVQAEVAVGAPGRAWALASPELTVATWTVQFGAAHADPDETRRLRTAVMPTATRRAPRRLRGLPSSLSLGPLEAKGAISSSSRRWPGSSSRWLRHRSL